MKKRILALTLALLLLLAQLPAGASAVDGAFSDLDAAAMIGGQG